MRKVLLQFMFGVALFMGGAAPAFSSSLEQPWVLNFSTGVTRAYFSVDTQVDTLAYAGGFGTIQYSLGDVVTPLFVVDVICDSSKAFSFTSYACDGSSYVTTITLTDCFDGGVNVLKRYTFPTSLSFSPICVSSAVINYPTQVYPVEVRYLNIGYTPVAIQQAVYSSTGALADFITFAPNETGGKAAWLFGAFCAFLVVVGLKMGEGA